MTTETIVAEGSARLGSVRNDGVGWLATFFGKPDVHGNSISFPVSEEAARRLKVGAEYRLSVRAEQ